MSENTETFTMGTSPSSTGPPKIFQLRAVTARIRNLFQNARAKRFWVQAHLVVKKGGDQGGHFHCELEDVDENGQRVARMSAVIWKSDCDAIRRKLREAGSAEALANNQEICALCSVSYHDVYGLKLQIHDVDPTFGEAQIDRNRRLILEKLKEEGILDRNKEARIGAAPLRVGLITANSSAALNDFKRTLSASAYAFEIILATSSMQGERTETDVLTAMRRLLAVNVDLICIVRGGGSPLDLAWFDNEKIARAIIGSRLPVWVGIGHEIDVGVLDLVATRASRRQQPSLKALAKIKKLTIGWALPRATAARRSSSLQTEVGESR